MLDRAREQEFLDVLKVFPEDAMTRFGLGNLYRDAGQTTDAEAQYRQAIASDPGYGAAYLELGAVQERLGRLDEARATYRQAIATAQQKGDQHIVNRATLRLEDLT